jgi:hypothetical protein
LRGETNETEISSKRNTSKNEIVTDTEEMGIGKSLKMARSSCRQTSAVCILAITAPLQFLIRETTTGKVPKFAPKMLMLRNMLNMMPLVKGTL